ncbi:sorbosone dehydrogenase family protein [Janthinobacterium sp. 17J80-10]|uniref:PQQ-dependent sugar dehydrogenase n=1 Tax=Janthinobacterium sp. 17J80-10 TaxID=2497863 RepID=UPI001005A2D9|nr:sorbosone dehydrogenase family protein [Janthinobacterium sp. 17J80-10]QAU32956.1 sorbosone dehydrogenase family protein [Janthinobacterium sp. 17J80-10]
MLSGCAVVGTPALPEQAGMGPTPQLPQPEKRLFPTVNIAPAKGWPRGAKPIAPQGFTVSAYASGLDHPRWLYVLPNGDVLVAETDAPAKPDDMKGVKGLAMKAVMKKAGAGVRPSANRITLLRGVDADGVAAVKSVFMSSLNSPFGMALVGNNLYVADTDAIRRYAYKEGQTEINEAGVKAVDLPAGSINHHWTKNILASPDGKFLYATVGSNSNVGENGMDKEESRAGILQVDLDAGKSRTYASGLRNPNGMGWQPHSGQLWTVVNERDELGNDLVPDYLTSVKEGGFYGWPYSYYGQHVDERVEEKRPDLVAGAIIPDYALGSHTAPLGLAFYDGKQFPAEYAGGAFIGLHGSWNRTPRSGYKVIFVPFFDGKPSGLPKDFLTGFLSDEGDAYGRPVGVAVDKTGSLLVADDVGNVVWRVAPNLASQSK